MKDSSREEQPKTGMAAQTQTDSPNQLEASKKVWKEIQNKKKPHQRLQKR